MRRDLRLLGDEGAEVLITGRSGRQQKNENGERKGSKAAIGSGARGEHSLTTQAEATQRPAHDGRSENWRAGICRASILP